MFNEATEFYSAAVISLSKIKSVIYRLLSDLSCRTERQQNIKSKGFQTIAKGIAHLESELKSEKTVKEIAENETGFDDPAYFCRVFKKQTGITAGEYLKEI